MLSGGPAMKFDSSHFIGRVIDTMRKSNSTLFQLYGLQPGSLMGCYVRLGSLQAITTAVIILPEPWK